jgi:hypothetical protein
MKKINCVFLFWCFCSLITSAAITGSPQISDFSITNQPSDKSVLPDYIHPFERSEANWMIELLQATEPQQSSFAPGSEPPFIMMAGYMDSDISYSSGGQLTMLAYVTDPDSPISSVEIYYDGQPTGVFLYDDGAHADYGAGDSLWGFSVAVPAQTVPAGEYLLELRAKDVDENYSDLWPYLTIH